MTHRFLTHFSTIFIVHAALIFGGLTIIENEVVTQKIGQHILNLKVAGEVLLSRPETVALPKTRSIAPSQVIPAQPVLSSEARPGEVPQVEATSLSGTAIADLKTIYKAELRARIDQNKFYPMAARRLGQTGIVIVSFTLLSDGSIMNIRIDSSSGNGRLDTAAVEAVKKVGKFKAIPKEFASSSMDMSVPIKFQTI